jgi:hypothetical protein
MLYILGLSAMKALFRFHYHVCQVQQRPLIYLFHSYEGTDDLLPDAIEHSKAVNPYFSVKPRRQKLYRFSAEEKYQLNMQLLSYMCNYKGARPMTASGFFAEHLDIRQNNLLVN